MFHSTHATQHATLPKKRSSLRRGTWGSHMSCGGSWRAGGGESLGEGAGELPAWGPRSGARRRKEAASPAQSQAFELRMQNRIAGEAALCDHNANPGLCDSNAKPRRESVIAAATIEVEGHKSGAGDTATSTVYLLLRDYHGAPTPELHFGLHPPSPRPQPPLSA